MEKEYLTVKEVAERIQVSVRTVWCWTAAGKLPAPFRLGRVVRWKRKAIEAYLESLPAKKRRA